MRNLKIQVRPTERTQVIAAYFAEISKIDMISIEEEIRLTLKIKQGDHSAAQKLVKANLRFVVSVAKQMSAKIPFEELIQEGNEGLIQAAYRFDETKGFKFISYAVWWIRQRMLDYIGKRESIIRLPNNVRLARNKALVEMDRVQTTEGIEISLEEAAERLELETSGLRHAANCWYPIQLDAPLKEDSENTGIDLVKSQDASECEPDKQRLLHQNLKRILTPLEYDVVTRFFGLGRHEQTLDSIAYDIKYTPERVRQIKEKAMKKLRSKKEVFQIFMN